MVRDVATVHPSTSLEEVERVLVARGCSSVAVVEDRAVIGVISRTDLLTVGRREAMGSGEPFFLLPSMLAGEVATRPAVTVSPDTQVSAAAVRMIKARIHRVYVEQDGRVAGVLSTKDLLGAIVADRVETALVEVMSHPVFTIPVGVTVGQAAERLAAAHVTGLVVVDEEGWPVGVFSQAEALASRQHSSSASIEDAMSCALVCLHGRSPLHRAAALARAARARRVLVIEDRRAVGVISPLDFVRAISA